MDRLKKEQSFR